MDKSTKEARVDSDDFYRGLKVEGVNLRGLLWPLACLSPRERVIFTEYHYWNTHIWVLSAIHRPTWSFLMLAIVIWTVFAPYAGYPEMPLSPMHKDIIQTVLIFYFAGRSIEKVAALAWGR